MSQRNLIAVIALAASACSSSSPGAPGISYDPCDAAVRTEGSADQRAAVDAALALWNAVAALDLAADAAAPPAKKRIAVVFEDTGPFHGFYDAEHGVVYLNERLEPDARPIVAAHELGHSFGLAHVDPAERASLMNPGNLDVPPTADDAAALWARWGKCAARPTGGLFRR